MRPRSDRLCDQWPLVVGRAGIDLYPLPPWHARRGRRRPSSAALGGSAANIAVGMRSAWRLSCRFVTTLSDDAVGRFAHERAQALWRGNGSRAVSSGARRVPSLAVVAKPATTTRRRSSIAMARPIFNLRAPIFDAVHFDRIRRADRDRDGSGRRALPFRDVSGRGSGPRHGATVHLRHRLSAGIPGDTDDASARTAGAGRDSPTSSSATKKNTRSWQAQATARPSRAHGGKRPHAVIYKMGARGRSRFLRRTA